MHEKNVCTLIDVDENNRQIAIKNYTGKVMFRAFGKIENPVFEQYEEGWRAGVFQRNGIK